MPIGINLSRGSRGLRPAFRGLGCAQALPFTPLAAGGGEEKRFLGTPQTPSKSLLPFAILLSSVRLMHIGQPQGIAPTMVRIGLPSLIVTIVGAIPCGCPGGGGPGGGRDTNCLI